MTARAETNAGRTVAKRADAKRTDPNRGTGVARKPRTPARTGLVFATVAALLLSAGWAANHFASVLVVLRDQQNYSPVLVNGAFGIYALGLVPFLLLGGMIADRVGARPVVLVGGFVASGLLAHFLPDSATIAVPFIVSVDLSLVAVAASAIVGDARHEPVQLDPPSERDPADDAPGGSHSAAADDGDAAVAKQPEPEPRPAHPHGMGVALATSLPMALWVFACVTTAFLVLAGRVSAHFESGVLLPGMAAVFAFGSGLTAQALGRKYGFGPRSGIAGALFAAAGMTLAALGAEEPPVWLFIVASMSLGTAYGLCLREGLLDIETFSPPKHRGTAIGIYYVFTYLGFGLPVLLEALLPIAGPTIPLLVLAAVSLGSALVRFTQLRAGVFAGR